MRSTHRLQIVAILGLLGCCGISFGQSAPPAQPKAKTAAPIQPVTATSPSAVAATINGQPLPEIMVQRALKRVPPAEQAKARAEFLEFLIDNILVEQYLIAQKIPIDAKEVQTRLGEIQTEMKNRKQDFAKMLQELGLSEEELKTQITADLRWEKFAMSRATDPALKDMFAKNTEMFDGSMVRARHVLITPASESAKVTLQNIKKEVLAAADAAMKNLPATADPLSREQVRAKALEEGFARAAEKYSACPSKRDGGDISWFPRAGSMVEPFAKAAFAMKPYEISDVVVTPFGLHLIMVTGRKPGQPVAFEKVKEEVRDVYCGQMRDSLCAQLRQSAKIVVTPVK